ncbi:MAG: hypothetical protein Q9M10_00375 [Mariprofundaceae bacterium]|nr:hypothetical protein [Mariprofundaceae bacterium]MDQ7001657.1 hypothetical protein [Ghiorsea sp.]
MKKILIGCTMMLAGAMSNMAIASEQSVHVHVAAFFKLPGQASFQWPEEIKGDDIIGALDGKADFLVLTQTVGIHNGDVLNIQNDVLREGKGSGFDDLGIDCQLSVNTSGAVWKVGGKCDIFLPHLNGGAKVVGIIKPHDIESEKVWHRVWRDPKSGVAVYFFKETGAVLGD